MMMESIGQQWRQVQGLEESTKLTIYSLYSDKFFIEVRSLLSQLLEDKFLDCELDSENGSHIPFIERLVAELNAEIKLKAHQLATQDSTSHVPFRLHQASNNISTGFPLLPVQLYQHITACLRREREIVRQAIMVNAQGNSAVANEIAETQERCNELRTRVSEIGRFLQFIQARQERVALLINNRANLDGILREHQSNGVLPYPEALADFDFEKSITSQKDQLEKEILQQVATINDRRRLLEIKLDEILQPLTEFQARILNALAAWKQIQRTTLLFTIGIDEIQKWFEGMADVLILLGNHLKEMSSLQQTSVPMFASNIVMHQHAWGDLSNYSNKLAQLMGELIYHTFIIETQPDQVIKKTTKFSTKLRILIGQKLNLPNDGPLEVEASILNDAGVKDWNKRQASGKPKTTGDLVNNKQKFQVDGGNSTYVAEYKNINIKKVKHSDKKESGHSVLDEPFWLLFQTQFVYNKVVYKLSALSVPIKVVSHVNQETQAWESLIWDDSGTDSGRTERKPWPLIAESLNNKFTSMTRRPLSPEQLQAIEQKAFSVPDDNGRKHSGDKKCLSWNQFCKNKIPKYDFTFWVWFYEIAKLTEQHLCGNKTGKSGPWQDGLIIGFIDRDYAQDWLLLNGKCGTFLLRYSDSQLGGISISCVHTNQNGEKHVMSVSPFNAKDLTARSLAERILDIGYLLYLYPDKPKYQAFQPYISAQTKSDIATPGQLKLTKSRYVRTILKTELIIEDEPVMQMSSPSGSMDSGFVPDSPNGEQVLSPLMLPLPLNELIDACCLSDENMDVEEVLSDNFKHSFEDYLVQLIEKSGYSPEQDNGYTSEDSSFRNGELSPSDSYSSHDLEYTPL